MYEPGKIRFFKQKKMEVKHFVSFIQRCFFYPNFFRTTHILFVLIIMFTLQITKGTAFGGVDLEEFHTYNLYFTYPHMGNACLIFGLL